MTSSDELKAIKECQAGNTGGFVALYDAYIQKIYRYIFYKTHHKETAEDLTSIVFTKALEKIKSFDSRKASFQTWIYSIARNTVIDNARTSKETINLENIMELASDDRIQEGIDIKAKIKDVQEYLNKLTAEQREIIILRLWEDMSYKEIAEIMGKTEASSKTMFSRAMKELRENISPVALILFFTAGM